MNQPVTIRSLHVYPVKGCAGIDVEEFLVWNGTPATDRAWMFVDAAAGAFVSQRTHPKLALVRPTLSPAGLRLDVPGVGTLDVPHPPPGPARTVTLWRKQIEADDCGDSIADAASAFLGLTVRLVRVRRLGRPATFADDAPFLVIGQASLDQLNDRRAEAGLDPVPMSRFRPSIVLDGLPPHGEDDVGQLVTESGVLLFLLTGPCPRCSAIEVDQLTGEPADDEVLRSLAAYRSTKDADGKPGVMFGQNASIVGYETGRLAVGQRLEIPDR